MVRLPVRRETDYPHPSETCRLGGMGRYALVLAAFGLRVSACGVPRRASTAPDARVMCRFDTGRHEPTPSGRRGSGVGGPGSADPRPPTWVL